MAGDDISTLMEENAFNDMRDNEKRKSKQQQRGEHYLSALTVSSAHTRCPVIPQIDLTDADVGAFTSVMCRAESFHPEALAKGKLELGVDPSSIVNGQAAWGVHHI